MQDLSKEDFISWKDTDVTKALFQRLQEQVENLKEILGNQAGLNATHDAQMVAMIRAYRNVLEVSFEELNGE